MKLYKGIDITGQKFGYLTAIRVTDEIKSGNRKWEFVCDCGNHVTLPKYNVIHGITSSCGCKHGELISKSKTKHGESKSKVNSKSTKLYETWKDMIKRCTNEKSSQYHNYGMRGISVCEEWTDFMAFREWAVKSGYDENLTKLECSLDRIDVNGNYCPENCRWATWKQQGRNRRTNVYYTARGESHVIPEWSEISGINVSTIRARINRGWSPEKAIFESIHTRKETA